MFAWFYSWFSSDKIESNDDKINNNLKNKQILKVEPTYYMTQDQLNNQIKSLKKITFKKLNDSNSISPLDIITKFTVNDILNQKKIKAKIHDNKNLSIEERKEKVKLFFSKIKKEKEEEEEMKKILNSSVLRRENKDKISEYFKNKRDI